MAEHSADGDDDSGWRCAGCASFKAEYEEADGAYAGRYVGGYAGGGGIHAVFGGGRRESAIGKDAVACGRNAGGRRDDIECQGAACLLCGVGKP